MRRLVVGAEHYPTVYRQLRRGASIRAALIPEPRNRFDHNAIAVHVNGVCAGYIGASTAESLQPLIISAERTGRQVHADGEVEMLDGQKAIRLALPWPRELAAWLRLPPERQRQGYAPPLVLTLKRLGDYQDALAKVLAGRRDTHVRATLSVDVTERGKYAGQNFIRVAVSDVEIGLLPAQFRGENDALYARVEAGTNAGEVYIQHADDRIWAQLAVY